MCEGPWTLVHHVHRVWVRHPDRLERPKEKFARFKLGRARIVDYRIMLLVLITQRSKL
jgi:hypothetical protein